MEAINYNTQASYTRFGRNGAILRARVGQQIEDAQIIARCPSVFAEDKHESRSERYTYLPTRELLAGLRREGFFPVEVRQGGSKDEHKRNFTKHMIRLRRNLGQLARVGDSIPEVVLINSHDGTSSYQLYQGWFRLVCLNGMVAADPNKPSGMGIKVGHRGDILGEVIEASYRVISDSDEMVPVIEEMTQLQLSQQEQRAFAVAAAELRLNDDAQFNPASILLPHRREDVGHDLWRVFNRAQENLTKGGVCYVTKTTDGKEQHRKAREPKSIDGNVKLNRALWTLAEEMRKIKAAA